MKLIIIMILIMGSTTYASWFQKKIDDQFLFSLFEKQGVPTPALIRTFEFLDLNGDKNFDIDINNATFKKNISNKTYAVIIDFTKPSSRRRLYLLNLKSGKVEKYYVAHGVNSGHDRATRFSNEIDSRKSSLGFFITGNIYEGKHGASLYLYGLEKSNDHAYTRDIVMHGADYVSMDFLKKHRRMGRSWGCPAVSRQVNEILLPRIKDGAIFYTFHNELMLMAQTSPTIQNVASDKQDTADNSNDIAAEEGIP